MWSRLIHDMDMIYEQEQRNPVYKNNCVCLVILKIPGCTIHVFKSPSSRSIFLNHRDDYLEDDVAMKLFFRKGISRNLYEYL